jgi:hypothetical protein
LRRRRIEASGTASQTAPTSTRAIVAPIGHSPDSECAPDIATTPAQLMDKKVHTTRATREATKRFVLVLAMGAIVSESVP